MGIARRLGPVFAYENLIACRRWQIYAGRSLLVACLLAGLLVVWVNRIAWQNIQTYAQLAQVSSIFVNAIMAVELVLALILVPAVTAGVICHDKMRGSLILMMVTDLTDREIVLGKLASRLMTVLGIIACGFPLMAIAMSLGGVDPKDLFFGSLVIVGVAVLGVCVALSYSVWASKSHEVLLATYGTYAVWLLALITWGEVYLGATPIWLRATNPFWLLFGTSRGAKQTWMFYAYPTLFFVACLLISALLTLYSTWRLRAATLRQRNRKRLPVLSFHRRSLRSARVLDSNPVFWREWYFRQPSAWGRGVWTLYALASSAVVVLLLLSRRDVGPGVCGFMVSIGFLLVTVTSATALSEERVLGSLDVLLATPMSTRSIVLGKWWGAFRIVPKLAILPAILVFTQLLGRRTGFEVIVFTSLIVGLILAYGAFISSFCLAMATWQPTLGRAVGMSVTAYIFMTVVLPFICIFVFRAGPEDKYILWVSPFFGMLVPIGWMTWFHNGDLTGRILAVLIWIIVSFWGAYGLLQLTIRSFDASLGRVPEWVSAKVLSRRGLHVPAKRERSVLP